VVRVAASTPMPTTDPLAGHVRVGREGTLVTITIQGRLDANAGVELLASLQDEIESNPERVDVDLQAVEGWTPEGARALRRARSLARVVSGGLHFRCAAGAGHDAVLEAFADDGDAGDGSEDGSADGDDVAGDGR